jgi:hypothetical protein
MNFFSVGFAAVLSFTVGPPRTAFRVVAAAWIAGTNPATAK